MDPHEPLMGPHEPLVSALNTPRSIREATPGRPDLSDVIRGGLRSRMIGGGGGGGGGGDGAGGGGGSGGQ